MNSMMRKPIIPDPLKIVAKNMKLSRDSDQNKVEMAKEHYGITENPREGGYIMPDGTMLDLSGRHHATGYTREGMYNVPMKGQPDYLGGRRSTDHREIPAKLTELSHGSGNELMENFMKVTGAIAMYQSGDSINVRINVHADVSPKQWSTLKHLSYGVDQIRYELWGEGVDESGQAYNVGQIRRAYNDARR